MASPHPVRPPCTGKVRDQSCILQSFDGWLWSALQTKEALLTRMKMVSRLLLLTAALAELVPAVAARRRSEAPATKALELLEKLWSQGQAELNDEALRFEKLKQWCADTAASKKSEIQDGEEKEERTSAVVESAEAAVAAVQEDIEELVAKAGKLDEKRFGVWNCRDGLSDFKISANGLACKLPVDLRHSNISIS
ncbi:unnamed protein product [Symbiodinium sp. CCMP2592]|nr:unnamed protein product [Symbiodinium sp. CCMP2592]